MIADDDAAEREVLDVLRDRYLSDGFQFIIHPSRELTPVFLGNYRPDAIALKGRGGVVIEIRGRDAGTTDGRAAELARLVGSQPGWNLDLVFASNFVGDPRFPQADGRAPAADEMREMRSEVDALLGSGHADAALMMAWALLEAAGRRLMVTQQRNARKPLTGWQMIERLASGGAIDFEELDRVQALMAQRNALVHGIPAARAVPEDVAYLLDIVDGLLAGEPA